MLWKAVYIFTGIPIKIPMSFFTNLTKALKTLETQINPKKKDTNARVISIISYQDTYMIPNYKTVAIKPAWY